jgi:hypothetical protein
MAQHSASDQHVTPSIGEQRTAGNSELRALPHRWRAVLLRPTISAFDAQQPAARWRITWLSLLILALINGLAVLLLSLGPGASAGVSSLPIGPTLHLPPYPLPLALAAFAGTFFELPVFSGLLWLSARLFGGRGGYRVQIYLMALFWLPLMALDVLLQLCGPAGSLVGLAARLYALYLCVPALASAQRLSLGRTLAALLLPVAFGLLLGVTVITALWPHITPMLR